MIKVNTRHGKPKVTISATDNELFTDATLVLKAVYEEYTKREDKEFAMLILRNIVRLATMETEEVLNMTDEEINQTARQDCIDMIKWRHGE